MSTALKNRLARIEEQTRREGSGQGFEIWVGTGDDELLGPTNEIISIEEFERRYPDAIDIGGPLGGGYERR